MLLQTFLNLHIQVAVLILAAMVLLYILSLVLKNSSIVDCFWGAGFVLIAWYVFSLTGSPHAPRDWLMVGLVTIWGLRLTAYVTWRNWGKGEDFRYTKWRNEHPDQWWWRSFFHVFILQGLIMWVVASPITGVLAAENSTSLALLDYLGIFVWVIGFFFESVGDIQLARFRANPDNKGQVLNKGVWHLTRHPNYFGDAAQWWGFYVIALSAGAWWTVISPLWMTYLLVKVSGVAMLERTLNYKPGYEAYAAKTSAFIPWFPKK